MVKAFICYRHGTLLLCPEENAVFSGGRRDGKEQMGKEKTDSLKPFEKGLVPFMRTPLS